MSDNYLSSLNKEQLEAVQSIDGPVMVMAGPGTGKTQVLAARIAHILKTTDTPPYAILALTFTESAAANMRERIVSLIGKDGYYVNISTFHSFCADVIRSNPEYFSIDRRSEPLGDLEKYDLFQNIINTNNFEVLKPINMPYFYIEDTVMAISQLKREGILPEQFHQIIKKEYSDKNTPERSIEKNKFIKEKKKNFELYKIYVKYQKKLTEIQRYDFDDMIAYVADAFRKEEDLLRDYQEKLLYFLVDEYQDTNSAQNNVVDLLGSYWEEKANIFVVGDPHQAIFRFQGASTENTQNFIEKYTEAKIIHLSTVYRCPQVICDAARDVIKNNKLTDVAPLHSVHKGGEKIHVEVLPNATHEIIYTAEKIMALIKNGVAPENIAILYRRNSEATEIQNILEKWSIPYEIDGGEDILVSEEIQQLLQLFRLIYDFRNNNEDETMFEVLSYQWIPVDKSLVMKVARAAGKAKLSIFALIQAGYDTFIKYHKTTEVTPIDFHQLDDFVKKLVILSHQDAHKPFTEWFEHALQETGFLDWALIQENKSEILININSLFREIKTLTASNHRLKLSDFINAIDTMQEHSIHIYAEDFNIKNGAVHLSTVHKAKGREWDYIFIIHCYDGNWGNIRKYQLITLPKGLTPHTDLSLKEKNEDERRLFYVAVTRARKGVFITYPETLIKDNRSKVSLPSMFIHEIARARITIINNSARASLSSHYLEKLLAPPSRPQFTTDKEFFARLVKDFKLSSTSLNSYLRDQNEFIRNSLLRVPRAKPAPMAYGTAIHAAFEYAIQQKLAGEKLRIDTIIHIFEIALKNEILSDQEYKRRFEKGTQTLRSYFSYYADDKPDVLFVERMFGYGFSKTVLNDIPLTGRIDRIDWLDKKNKSVRVVDYKTGKAKSSNDIKGITVATKLSERELSLPESIRGPYKRQLIFYALLTHLDQTFVPKVEEGMFDFVEPDEKTGKHIRRIFSIHDEEVEDLKKLIIQVMSEIRSLAFLK